MAENQAKVYKIPESVLPYIKELHSDFDVYSKKALSSGRKAHIRKEQMWDVIKEEFPELEGLCCLVLDPDTWTVGQAHDPGNHSQSIIGFMGGPKSDH